VNGEPGTSRGKWLSDWSWPRARHQRIIPSFTNTPGSRMRSNSARLAAVVALLALSGCSFQPGINPTLEQDELTPPRPIAAGGPSLIGATATNPVALDVLVQVDTLGRADLATLQVTGSGAEANRPIVADWLRTARFEPARVNGYLVKGWFRMLAEAKAARTR